jgi:hypothetical protein
MKRTNSKKLDLRRETLAPLQADDLYDVAGGQGDISALSITLITTVTTVSIQQTHPNCSATLANCNGKK